MRLKDPELLWPFAFSISQEKAESSGTSQPPLLSCRLCLPGELLGIPSWPEEPNPIGLSSTKLHPQIWQLELHTIPSLRSQVIQGCSWSKICLQANEFCGQEDPPRHCTGPSEPQLSQLRDPKVTLPTPSRPRTGSFHVAAMPLSAAGDAYLAAPWGSLQGTQPWLGPRAHLPRDAVSGQHPWAPRERRRAGRKR